MNVALRRRTMTLEEFLEWEERQPVKYEFDGTGPVAMVGVTVAHSAIQRNLLLAIGNRLRGQPCQVHGSELKIQVAGRIRYPDAFVICAPISPRATVVGEPIIVFEILSESTAAIDLTLKNAEYRDTPSIQRYVILQQLMAAATVFTHRSGQWATDVVVGPEALLALPEIGIEVSLSELYEGLEFPAVEG